jgi:predicted nucleic acid-binding protein
VASPFAGPVILVDTSVWVDHLRVGDALLARLLDRGETLGHPWVTGELALGNLREGSEVLRLLEHLPQATVATAAELLEFINRPDLSGLGIGYVDAQLLAATMLTGDGRLWTRDRRLCSVAETWACTMRTNPADRSTIRLRDGDRAREGTRPCSGRAGCRAPRHRYT